MSDKSERQQRLEADRERRAALRESGKGDDLVAFLTARLDEDEHIAHMAAGDASASADWHTEARYPGSGSAGIVGENGEKIVSDEGFPGQMEAEHIARFDPARALREVEAKRAAVVHYEATVTALRARLIEQVAAVYSDHPDYRQEWGA